MGIVRSKDERMLWLQEGIEWAIGNCANYMLSLLLNDHPDMMRNVTLRPLPRSYFQGPLVMEIYPTNTDVYSCFRQNNDTEIALSFSPPPEHQKKNTLMIKMLNVSKIVFIFGIPDETWS